MRIEKLCALVPTPRAHTVRYHGILGPAAKWRPFIVPSKAPTAAAPEPENVSASSPASGSVDPTDRGQQPDAPAAVQRHPRNYLWSELMKRVFNQPTNCIACRRNVRPCPDHSSVPSALRAGNRFRQSYTAMG